MTSTLSAGEISSDDPNIKILLQEIKEGSINPVIPSLVGNLKLKRELNQENPLSSSDKENVIDQSLLTMIKSNVVEIKPAN